MKQLIISQDGTNHELTDDDYDEILGILSRHSKDAYTDEGFKGFLNPGFDNITIICNVREVPLADCDGDN